MRDNRSDWTGYLERFGKTRYETQAHNIVPRVELTLPWPPSVNGYWRHVGNKVLISADGRKYRETVKAIVTANGAKRLPLGRYGVSVTAFSPDNRRRDIDNLLKALLDALEHAGVYSDDSMIDTLLVRRMWLTARRGEVDVTAKVTRVEGG